MLDTIGRKGSFATVAYGLNGVPSALTYVMRKLEDDLDVLLFNRCRHRAELTPTGCTLLGESRHLLQVADNLIHRTRRLAAGWETTLAIVINDLVHFHALIPVIQDFYVENTATRSHFCRETLTGTQNVLLSGRADLLVEPTQMMQARDIQVRAADNILSALVVTTHHLLVQMKGPLPTAAIMRRRIAAVGDTSRNLPAYTIGVVAGQDTPMVPSIADKAQA